MSLTVNNTDIRASFKALGSNAPTEQDMFLSKLNKISRPLRTIANAISDTTLIKKVDAFSTSKIDLKKLDESAFPKTLSTINAVESQLLRKRLESVSLEATAHKGFPDLNTNFVLTL